MRTPSFAVAGISSANTSLEQNEAPRKDSLVSAWKHGSTHLVVTRATAQAQSYNLAIWRGNGGVANTAKSHYLLHGGSLLHLILAAPPPTLASYSRLG
jgi:hypothetical protein